MKTIKLDVAEWKYDPDKQLSSKGGFGAVFAGTGQGHSKLAIKKLNIEAKDAAHRELRIAKDLENRKLSHVIPVLDSGQDADSDFYFVVMALADKSLQDDLDSRKTFTDTEVASILLQIVEGLCELSKIVHRDLKPGNVLFHQGKWKVADFGIARFVEESTSLQTLKNCLTPQYAAPEQWEFERSTAATDIYALGCIGYSLLTGHPPFQGSNETLKHQHLTESAPVLKNHNPQLCSLLSRMLRKKPETRPDLGRVKRTLEEISKGDNNWLSQIGLSALIEAGAKVATCQAKEEAKLEAKKVKLKKRVEINNEAFHILVEVIDKMFDKILHSAPVANCHIKLSQSQDNVLKHGSISIGTAKLSLEYLKTDNVIRDDAFPRSKWDVITGAIILVEQQNPRYLWSSTLWYSKLPDHDNYRWREVSYYGNPLIPKDKLNIECEPCALKSLTEADEAASPTSNGRFLIAFGPKPIDDEDFDNFCNRWADILAKAANGQLSHPRTLPLQ
jgi:serine/threonine-protein kinase